MSKNVDSTKKAEITMRMSEFEMPPVQDALIVGKRAPIGPEAARRMVDILSPNQYEIVKVDHKCAEACEAMVQDILSRIKQYEFCEGISISVSAGIAGGRRRNPRKRTTWCWGIVV